MSPPVLQDIRFRPVKSYKKGGFRGGFPFLIIILILILIGSSGEKIRIKITIKIKNCLSKMRDLVGRDSSSRESIDLGFDGVSPYRVGEGGLVPANTQSQLKFRGKLGDLGHDFGRLLRDGLEHFVAQFRPEADQFEGRDHQGQLIIDLMAHVRELFIQLFKLLRRQGYRNIGQSHPQDHVPNPAPKQACLVRSC
jgi:hypothetical protein